MQNPPTKIIDRALKSWAREDKLSIRISGRCMQPLINDGALVSVCRLENYWPGDIIVKRCPDRQLVAHRLIGFFPRKGILYYVTRADNANKSDTPVRSAEIIGRVSGGECADMAVSVPIRHRFKAAVQFVILVIKRLWHRLVNAFY